MFHLRQVFFFNLLTRDISLRSFLIFEYIIIIILFIFIVSFDFCQDLYNNYICKN